MDPSESTQIPRGMLSRPVPSAPSGPSLVPFPFGTAGPWCPISVRTCARAAGSYRVLARYSRGISGYSAGTRGSLAAPAAAASAPRAGLARHWPASLNPSRSKGAGKNPAPAQTQCREGRLATLTLPCRSAMRREWLCVSVNSTSSPRTTAAYGRLSKHSSRGPSARPLRRNRVASASRPRGERVATFANGPAARCMPHGSPRCNAARRACARCLRRARSSRGSGSAPAPAAADKTGRYDTAVAAG